MRLSETTIQALQKAFTQVFEQGDLYLIGSRLDDTRKGGDIDLYINTNNIQNLGEKRLAFLAQVKQTIGDQRIDLVINRGTHRPIDQIATQEGIILCQRP